MDDRTVDDSRMDDSTVEETINCTIFASGDPNTNQCLRQLEGFWAAFPILDDLEWDAYAPQEDAPQPNHALVIFELFGITRARANQVVAVLAASGLLCHMFDGDDCSLFYCDCKRFLEQGDNQNTSDQERNQDTLQQERDQDPSEQAHNEDLSAIHLDPETKVIKSFNVRGHEYDYEFNVSYMWLDYQTEVQPIRHRLGEAGGNGFDGNGANGNGMNGNGMNGNRVNGNRVNGNRVNGNRVNGNRVNRNRVNGNGVNGNGVNGNGVNGNEVNGNGAGANGA